MSNFFNSDSAAFTSDKDDWETPQALFDELNAKYHFELDAAASDNNHKLDRYYTSQDNALLQKWGGIRLLTHHTGVILVTG